MGGCLYKLGASAAASEFCEWAQLGINVYILHCKYHVKPPWFLVSCAAAIANINHFFCVQQQNKSSEPKVEFRQFSNPCKRVLEAAKRMYGNKTTVYPFPETWLTGLWQIANIVLNKAKFVLPSLFNDPEVLSSASDKANFFPKTFSRNSNLDDLGISLHVLSSRTYLRLYNISVILKLVKNIITNLSILRTVNLNYHTYKTL